MAKKIALDIGYSEVRIALEAAPKQYIIEKSVMALSTCDGGVVACGEDALGEERHIPGSVGLIYPFSGEMIPDPIHITEYFSYIIRKYRLKGASVIMSISGSRDAEAEGVYVKSLQDAGFGTVSSVDSAYAAAHGCGVSGVGDSAVVNIGASVIDMACYSRGSCVAQKSNSFGGNAFDKAIITGVLKDKKLRLSAKEAERIKISLADLSGGGDKIEEADVIRPGLGLPKKLILNSKEVSVYCEAVFENLADEISDMVRSVKTEPDKIILTGGGAKLKGLVSSLSPLLLLPIEIAKEPENSVIRGLEMLMLQNEK